MKINLGAGHKIEPGFVNYDINPLSDEVEGIDLETEILPHEDNSVDFAQAIHTLEHIKNLTHVMDEVHRVLKPDGRFLVRVPRFPHEDAIKDPTHVRFFVPETFHYFENEKTCEMYGWKRWSVASLEEKGAEIVAELVPDK